MNIAIDLDETIINTKLKYSINNDNKEDFNIKRGAKKYLPLIAKKYTLHLITSRNIRDYSNVEHIIKRIEGSLNIQFKSITLTSGNPKGTYAGNLNCKYIIDNTYKKISNSLKYGVIPIHLNGKRFKCWRDIYDYII